MLLSPKTSILSVERVLRQSVRLETPSASILQSPSLSSVRLVFPSRAEAAKDPDKVDVNKRIISVSWNVNINKPYNPTVS